MDPAVAVKLRTRSSVLQPCPAARSYHNNADDPMPHVQRVLHYVRDTYPQLWARNGVSV